MIKLENNKDNNISIGASGQSTVTQKIERKKDFSIIELLKWLGITLIVILLIIALVAYLQGKPLSDLVKFIPKFSINL